MDTPTFTVVMPAFNTASTIGIAVRSVLAQTRRDFELVVVDDGSTDNTAEVVEAMQDDERIRLLRQENKGAAAARNTALSDARGRYVSLIDSDDMWLPTYLEAMAASLDHAVEDVGFSYTNAWTLNPVTGQIGKATAMEGQRPPLEPPSTAEALLLELLDRNFIYNSVTVRRAVFEQLGTFDESLQAAIDYEMWLRIVAHGYKAVSPGGLLAVYRRDRPGSISSNRAVVCTSLLRVYDRVVTDLAVAPRARQVARERMAAVQDELSQLERSSRLYVLWRTGVRPPLARVKNAIFPRPDEWLTAPPPELVKAFPDLFASAERAVSSTAAIHEPA